MKTTLFILGIVILVGSVLTAQLEIVPVALALFGIAVAV